MLHGSEARPVKKDNEMALHSKDQMVLSVKLKDSCLKIEKLRQKDSNFLFEGNVRLTG